MAETETPAWLGAATAAAVRLAAESGADVDDILEHGHGASADRLAFQVTRLEQSADLSEVASDLAGLLWAECADVPPIATILEEPAAQAALEAVAEARLQAARRLAATTTGHESLVDPAPPADTAELLPAPTAAAVDPLPPVPKPQPVPSPAQAAAANDARRPARGAVLAGAAATAIVLFGRKLRRA